MNPDPTLHSVYMFFPPNSAQLVLHADNHVEIRFERTRTAEILKWWEDRTNQFRLELNYHRYGPQPIEALGNQPSAIGNQQEQPSAIGIRQEGETAVLADSRQPKADGSPGQTLPVGTLLSRDQVAQLMKRYPNMKLEGEGLYRACVELGFVKTNQAPGSGLQAPEQIDSRLSTSEQLVEPGVPSPEPVVVYESLAEPLDEQGKMLMRPNESVFDFIERVHQVRGPLQALISNQVPPIVESRQPIADSRQPITESRPPVLERPPVLASRAGTLDGMAGGTITTRDGRLATAENRPQQSAVGSRQEPTSDLRPPTVESEPDL